MQILRKYLWQFFYLYCFYYFISVFTIIAVDNFCHLGLHDLPVILTLCVTLPNTVAMRFIKNEKRCFNDAEKKLMIKRSSMIAWIISTLLSILYIGHIIAMKLMIPASQIPLFLASANLPASSSISIFLKMPIAYLCVMLSGMLILYYALIRYLIQRSFNRITSRALVSE